MLTTLLGLGLLIILAYLFFSLMGRAFRARSVFVRVPGVLITAVLGLAFSALVVIGIAGLWRLEAPRARPVPEITVAGTPEQIARGEQLAWLCVECHSTEGQPPLNGASGNMLAAGGPPLGSVYGQNLTPGGPLRDWSDGHIIRAVREGLDEDGVPLVFMPSQAFRAMSDDDVQSVVAYLRSQPALRHDQPRRNLNILAVLLFGAGLAPTSEQPPATGPVEAPPRAATSDYGRYLVSISGCTDCHGVNLDGVPWNRFAPRGPSLRGTGAGWTSDQFVTLFRTGMAPENRPVSEAMPWRFTGKAMTDPDLRAMHAYLSTLQ